MSMVSVIIPSYCHAPYLRARIESVLHQSYTDIEVIIVDDCSTDGSQSIIESYRSDARVSHIVYNERNSGSTFKQWARGLALARGEWVWIAESDDYADPEFLARCVAELESNPGSVLAYTGSMYVDSASRELPNKRRDTSRRCEVRRGRDFVEDYMLTCNVVYNASMAVFSRSAVPDMGDVAQYRYCGDWLFWSLVALQGNVVRIRESLNYFRQHDVKVSPRAEREGLQFIEGADVVERLLDCVYASPLRRRATAGTYMRKIKKFARTADADTARRVYDLWRQRFGHPALCEYIRLVYKLKVSRCVRRYDYEKV